MPASHPPRGAGSGVRGPTPHAEGEEERTPLLDDAGRRMLERLREHPDAPRWTYAVGDRLAAEDLPALDRFRGVLAAGRVPSQPWIPSPVVLQSVAHALVHVPRYRASVPAGLDLERDWNLLPTTCRADLAAAPGSSCRTTSLSIGWSSTVRPGPRDTRSPSRTTRGPSPATCRCWSTPSPRTACTSTPRPTPWPARCSRSSSGRTPTAPCSRRGPAAASSRSTCAPPTGPRPDSPARYLADLAPQLVTGEPVVFSELLRLGVRLAPRAMVSTSLSLPDLAASRSGTALRLPGARLVLDGGDRPRRLLVPGREWTAPSRT